MERPVLFLAAAPLLAIGAAAPPWEGAPAPGAPPPSYQIIPLSFEQLYTLIRWMSPTRETPVWVEQVIPAGASGTVTVSIPADYVDIQKSYEEGGDNTVQYSIDIDAAGRTAQGTHRIYGPRQLEFGTYWEKYSSVIVNFTNLDPLLTSLLQLHWQSIQLPRDKWAGLSANLKLGASLMGIPA